MRFGTPWTLRKPKRWAHPAIAIVVVVLLSLSTGSPIAAQANEIDQSGGDIAGTLVFHGVGASPESEYGHAWVSWLTSEDDVRTTYEAWGMYPIDASFKAVLGTVPARISDEAFEQGHYRFYVQVSQAQFERSHQVLTEWRAATDSGETEYNMLAQNCVDFVAEVAEAIGLDVPTIEGRPEQFVIHLAELNS